MSAMDTRHGIGVSPGIAVGPVVQVRPPVRTAGPGACFARPDRRRPADPRRPGVGCCDP